MIQTYSNLKVNLDKTAPTMSKWKITDKDNIYHNGETIHLRVLMSESNPYIVTADFSDVEAPPGPGA